MAAFYKWYGFFVFLLLGVSPAFGIDIHWAISSSPIIISNDVTINEGDRLIIDPGVAIRFAGYYKINLYGTLIAKGTVNEPISFQSNDTTGFSDCNSTAGGWNGIVTYGNSNPEIERHDTLLYCTFQHIKLHYQGDGIWFSGSPYIDHCKFFNNSSPEEYYPQYGLINLTNYSVNSLPVFQNCEFYNNSLYVNTIFGSVYALQYQNNQMHDNTARYGIYLVVSGDSSGAMNITHNDFRNNNYLRYDPGGAGPPVSLYGFKNIAINNNVFYNNQSYGTGCLLLNQCNGTVDNNLIINNRTLLEPGKVMCVGLSGAIIQFSGGIDSLKNNDAKIYLRNNIISNNYTTAFGIITLHYQNTEISNNTILNNSSWGFEGSVIYTWGENKYYNIVNNIIQNNTLISSPIGANTSFRFAQSNTFRFDYNYLDTFLYNALSDTSIIASLGDTSHNIIGNNASFENVVMDTNTNFSCENSDFSLTNNSPCIDLGSNNSSTALQTDYLGLPRVINNIIDIGAIEYNADPNQNTGISNIQSGIQYEAFPNPARNEIFLSFTKEFSGEIVLLDMTGKKIIQNTLNNCTTTTLNLYNVVPGIYFLNVYSSSGNRSCRKIIVE